MTIEQLQYLISGCQKTIKDKRKEAIWRDFTALNLQAHSLGFDLCYTNPDVSDDKYVLDQYNFEIVERKSC
jgi:hypothetical protein